MSKIFDMPERLPMSFREKSAWISFGCLLVVFGTYFGSVALVLSGRMHSGASLGLGVGLLAAFVILEIVLHVAIAIQSPGDARAPKDERERLIEMRATHRAFPVLVLGALAGVGTMHLTRSNWVVGHVVLLAVVVAELVKFGGQIVSFRRDA